MKSEFLLVSMFNLVHEMREMNDLIILPTTFPVGNDLGFILIKITGENAHGILFINDGGAEE